MTNLFFYLTEMTHFLLCIIRPDSSVTLLSQSYGKKCVKEISSVNYGWFSLKYDDYTERTWWYLKC